MLRLHCMVNNVLMFLEWDKRQISEYTMYINPLSLSVRILRFSACRRGSYVTKHTERYFSLCWYVGLMTFSFCHTSKSVNILVFYLWKLYVNSQKLPNYTVTNTLKLTDCHWKLVEITLYIGIHDIRLLWKWHRYPALDGFQKAKSIQCYTRHIMSKLGQRKQISNKKGHWWINLQQT